MYFKLVMNMCNISINIIHFMNFIRAQIFYLFYGK
jgi:hypothetical protein